MEVFDLLECMCATRMQCSRRPKEVIGSPGTEVIPGCELLDVVGGAKSGFLAGIAGVPIHQAITPTCEIMLKHSL